MSYWYEADKDCIEINGDEIEIYAGYDDSGNRYVTVKIKDIWQKIKEYVKDLEK